jgi:hypothetical protein
MVWIKGMEREFHKFDATEQTAALELVRTFISDQKAG